MATFGEDRAAEFGMLATDVDRLNIGSAATLLRNASDLVSIPMQYIEADDVITAAAHLALTSAVTAAEYVNRTGPGGNRHVADDLKQAALTSIASVQALVVERAKPNDRARAVGLA